MAKRNEVWKEKPSEPLPASPQKVEDEPLGIAIEVDFCMCVNVREAPGKEGKTFTVLPKGERLTLISESKDWSRVKLGDGRTGYIMTEFLRMVENG